MSIVKDSTEVKTVIAYPQKDKIVTTKTVTVAERNSFEGKMLYSPSYESVLLSATILSVGLLFSAYLYYKRQKEIVLWDYFNFRQTEKKYIHLNFLIVVLDLLGLVVVSSLGYYFLSAHSSYSGWGAFAWIVVACLLLLLLRVFLIFITGYLVKNRELATRHLQVYYFSSKLLTLGLLPALLLALLIPEEGYWIILLITLLVFVFRAIVLFIFVSRFLKLAGFSVFHSFLYLCTLELLPFLYAVIFIKFFN